MKILLDECVTKHLKPELHNHEVFTVREMDWGGFNNGALMRLCCEGNFDLILTIDKNMQYQQNLENYPITIVVFNTYSSKLKELREFIPSFYSQLSVFKKHKVYIIEK